MDDLKMLMASLLLALLTPATLYGQTSVYRCQFHDGKVLFSQKPCPANSQAADQNITPNTPIQLIPKPANAPKKSFRTRGISATTKCQSDLNEQALRQALIRQQPRKGMSRAQVLSAFGKPERISSNSQGERFTYQLADGQKRTLQFDEHGCLKR